MIWPTCRRWQLMDTIRFDALILGFVAALNASVADGGFVSINYAASMVIEDQGDQIPSKHLTVSSVANRKKCLRWPIRQRHKTKISHEVKSRLYINVLLKKTL